MKKSYETPRLVVHGTVEEITRAATTSGAYDGAFIGPSTVVGEDLIGS